MWYKIQFPPYDDNNFLLGNYLCYSSDKGFYLGNWSRARFFRTEHLQYDKRLTDFLVDKDYKLIECKGKHTFMVYRGSIS